MAAANECIIWSRLLRKDQPIKIEIGASRKPFPQTQTPNPMPQLASIFSPQLDETYPFLPLPEKKHNIPPPYW